MNERIRPASCSRRGSIACDGESEGPAERLPGPFSEADVVDKPGLEVEIESNGTEV